MIKIENVSVVFSKGTSLEHWALKNLSLHIMQSDWITVVGGNGAGKSTLMNLLSGDVVPQAGRILLNDQNVNREQAYQRAHWISRVFQDPLKGTCADLTLEQNFVLAATRTEKRSPLKLALSPSLRSEIKARVASLGLGLEKRLKDKIGVLSGGQRQAISLLLATFRPSKLFLLDEHTAALDPKMAATVMDLTRKIIEEQKLTTIMITHSLNQSLHYGNRTAVMNEGRIIKDFEGEGRERLTPSDLMDFIDGTRAH